MDHFKGFPVQHTLVHPENTADTVSFRPRNNVVLQDGRPQHYDVTQLHNEDEFEIGTNGLAAFP